MKVNFAESFRGGYKAIEHYMNKNEPNLLLWRDQAKKIMVHIRSDKNNLSAPAGPAGIIKIIFITKFVYGQLFSQIFIFFNWGKMYDPVQIKNLG
jgi:hypothetical protein